MISNTCDLDMPVDDATGGVAPNNNNNNTNGNSNKAADPPAYPSSTGDVIFPAEIDQCEAIEKQKIKTVLCANYMHGERCRYGSRCAFAHGVQELRPAPPEMIQKKFEKAVASAEKHAESSSTAEGARGQQQPPPPRYSDSAMPPPPPPPPPFGSRRGRGQQQQQMEAPPQYRGSGGGGGDRPPPYAVSPHAAEMLPGYGDDSASTRKTGYRKGAGIVRDGRGRGRGGRPYN